MLKNLVVGTLGVLSIIGVVWGTLYLVDLENEKTAKRARDYRDPAIPPALHDFQRNPDWTIRKWLEVGHKSASCEVADEMMDRNEVTKVVRLGRRAKREKHLADYVSSCRDAGQYMIRIHVEPQATKWCLYRHTDPRLDVLCREWTENKSAYLEEIEVAKEPTLARYRSFSGGQ